MAEKSDIKVLLVDDEEILLEYMSKRLVREGFTVKTTLSGEGGLEAATGEKFDVAVVDLKMPGMDGVETQRALKKIQPFLQCISRVMVRSIRPLRVVSRMPLNTF